jgi:hypothetical protein
MRSLSPGAQRQPRRGGKARKHVPLSARGQLLAAIRPGFAVGDLRYRCDRRRSRAHRRARFRRSALLPIVGHVRADPGNTVANGVRSLRNSPRSHRRSRLARDSDAVLRRNLLRRSRAHVGRGSERQRDCPRLLLGRPLRYAACIRAGSGRTRTRSRGAPRVGYRKCLHAPSTAAIARGSSTLERSAHPRPLLRLERGRDRQPLPCGSRGRPATAAVVGCRSLEICFDARIVRRESVRTR